MESTRRRQNKRSEKKRREERGRERKINEEIAKIGGRERYCDIYILA